MQSFTSILHSTNVKVKLEGGIRSSVCVCIANWHQFIISNLCFGANAITAGDLNISGEEVRQQNRLMKRAKDPRSVLKPLFPPRSEGGFCHRKSRLGRRRRRWSLVLLSSCLRPPGRIFGRLRSSVVFHLSLRAVSRSLLQPFALHPSVVILIQLKGRNKIKYQ